MLLKLTSKTNDKPVLVNWQMVQSVEPFGIATSVVFGEGESDEITVTETVEEIAAQIEAHEARKDRRAALIASATWGAGTLARPSWEDHWGTQMLSELVEQWSRWVAKSESERQAEWQAARPKGSDDDDE